MDKTERTIETYNKHVASYENKFMDFDNYKKRIQAFCDILEPKASILDIGCGPGNVEKLRRVLFKNGFEIIDLQRDVYLENDGSKTIDMFFFAQKNCRAGEGV